MESNISTGHTSGDGNLVSNLNADLEIRKQSVLLGMILYLTTEDKGQVDID